MTNFEAKYILDVEGVNDVLTVGRDMSWINFEAKGINSGGHVI